MRIGSQALRKVGVREDMLGACFLLLAAISSTLIIFAVFSWRYHEKFVAEARLETKRLSLSLAEQATRTFDAVDFTLRGLEPLLETKEVPPHDTTIEVLLHKRSSELGFVEDIRIVDSRGEQVQRSGSPSSRKNEASRGFLQSSPTARLNFWRSVRRSKSRAGIQSFLSPDACRNRMERLPES
jgi:hypothetical protein